MKRKKTQQHLITMMKLIKNMIKNPKVIKIIIFKVDKYDVLPEEITPRFKKVMTLEGIIESDLKKKRKKSIIELIK